MISFAFRNLKLFFKDKTAVFFSLLAVLIIIGLYAFFLGDVWVSSFKGMSGVKPLMATWVMAGILAVASITTTMGAFQPMIDDRAKGIVKDFSASPVKNSTLVGGYVLSAFIIGVIMTTVTLILGEMYIVYEGGRLITLTEFAKVFGLILLAGVGNTTAMLFIVSIMKSQTAFSTMNSIIGTLIGFMTGIYLPIGNLPEGLQSLIKLFPPSHAALMFRSVMMEHAIGVTFKGVPDSAVEEFKTVMGVTFHLGDSLVQPALSISIIIASAVLFYLLAVMVLARKKR